ncbi:MAG: chaperonin GroEL, partial [Bacilli bacterium]|nr:chaperonin GroEL [Bacilli bacterium]
MKKVINNQELIKVEEEAIKLLCDTVKETLGPTGNNIIINRGDQSPFITNDGVTIAESIESDDKRINTVLEIIKEASLKTNEEVGDGTTTTLVLLQGIFKEGLKYIKNGKNKIKLKQELLLSINKVL